MCAANSTARDAMMMNYKTIFVSDGTATFNDEEHNATLGIMLAMFADVMTTDEVVARCRRIIEPGRGIVRQLSGSRRPHR